MKDKTAVAPHLAWPGALNKNWFTIFYNFMSGEFWNAEQFDEEKHLTAREVWETLGKYFIVGFDNIIVGVEIGEIEKRRQIKDEIGGYKTGAEQMGLPPASPEKLKEWAKRDAAAKKSLEMTKEYENARMAEEEARAFRQKDFNHFLTARRDVIALQQKIVQTFRPYFVEKVLEFYDKLKDGAIKQVKTEEAYRDYSDGILSAKKGLRKEKQVPPDFVPTKDVSDLCVHVLDEGLLKLLTDEEKIIRDRLSLKRRSDY